MRGARGSGGEALPLLLALVSLLLSPTSASATEPPADAPEPELSVSVRAPRVAADGGAATRVETGRFPGELRHAAELVGLSPGATVLDFGGLLATTTISLRGASADQVQVTFDGIPLNASAGGGSDLSLVPAALLDAVEIRRGSEGATLGAGAMGGSVSLEPASRDRALLSAGSFGTYAASASRRIAPADGLTLLLAADLRRSAGDFDYSRDPTPELPDNDPLEALRRTNNDALLGSVLLRGEHLAGARRLQGTLLLAGVDRGLPGPIYSPTGAARQREASTLGQVRWSAPLGRGAQAPVLDLPLSFRGGLLESRRSGPGEADGVQRTADLSLRPALRGSFGELGWIARGALGAELFDGESHGARRRLRAGGGLELLRERGTWTFAGSARAERWGDAVAILGRLGGSVRLTPQLTLAAQAGNGFRPPSFGELYYAAGPVIPNPDLLPERSISGDLGLRFSAGPLRLGALAFGGLYENVIVYELYPGFRAKPFNVGRSSAMGAELEARWSGSELLRGLDARLAWTELATANLVPGHTTQGNDLPYRPRRRVVARADYVRPRWRAAVELQAVSAAFANRANTRSVPGYADLRGGGGYRVAGDLWLSAELRNALDVRDRASIDGYPLPGRILFGHLSWEPGGVEQ